MSTPSGAITELAEAAWQAARSAMQDYADDEMYRFAREAARAIELAGKALLARISPVLIADPKSLDTQLHLAGASLGTPPRIRTIGARDVLERLRRLLPAFPSGNHLNDLIDVRDGYTHYLVGQHDVLEGMVVAFLQALQVIQQELGVSDAEVFLDDAQMVSTVREEHAKRVEKVVATKMARARSEYAKRYGHLSPDELEQVLRLLSASISLEKYEDDIVPCPVCEFDAVASGQVEVVDWEADYDVDGDDYYVSGVTPIVRMHATRARCRACGLELNGSDELEAVQLPTEFTVEDVDPSDFDYDPDDREYDYDYDR